MSTRCRARRRAPLAIVLLLGTAQVGTPLPATAQQWAVRGHVVDGATDAPVARSVVELLGGQGERFAAVLSDSVGAFVLQAEGPGRYRVRGHAGAAHALQCAHVP